MGFGQQIAANYGASMAQVALDLGSFFNRSTEDALMDIQSALAGSSETMQKYGIDVRETALKQEALDRGWIQSSTDVIPRLQRSHFRRRAAEALGWPTT